jgi:ABC-2 type transport system permease protein
MTTTQISIGSQTRRPDRVREHSRALALGHAETILLLRNPTALMNALLLPILLAFFFATVIGGSATTGAVLGMIAGTGLIFIVYYTTVTSVVARREERTLKRLYTGQARPTTILLGMVLPLFVLLVAQVLLGAVAVGLLVGWDGSSRVWLLVPALVLGAVAWWALALASTTFTKTVESAQITTLPLIMVALLFSGVSLPLGLLPETLQTVAQLTPMYPVVELLQLSLGSMSATGQTLSGHEVWLAVARDLAVLAAWTVLSAVTVRRRFQWEPRR